MIDLGFEIDRIDENEQDGNQRKCSPEATSSPLHQEFSAPECMQLTQGMEQSPCLYKDGLSRGSHLNLFQRTSLQ
jgi:hypothetical protein